MFNFIYRDDFQCSLAGSIIFGCGTVLNYIIGLKKELNQQIQLTQRSKIYELQQFLNLQFSRRANNQKNNNQPRNDGESFLVKAIPNVSPLTYNKDIYSNQMYFCPPSLNLLFKDCLKKQNKKFQYQKINLKEINVQSQRFFRGIILTDKFEFETKYQPRKIYEITNVSSNKIIRIFKSSFYWFSQKIYRFRQNLAYYFQKALQKVNFRIRQRRSRNEKRYPFFRGIRAGNLSTNFNFLRDTNFLLKVKVEGTDVFTQVVADNKLMIVDYYKWRIGMLNLSMVHISFLLFAAVGKLVKSFHLPLKKIWFKLTNTDRQLLNLKSVSDDKLCQICYVDCRNILFYPCRHFIVCQDCNEHLEKKDCIICNIPLSKAQPIYIKSN